jgi:phosphonate transport system substrate-binding protein
MFKSLLKGQNGSRRCLNASASTMAVLFLSLFLVTLQSRAADDLGTPENPVKFFLVPSSDSKKLEDKGKILRAYLEKSTPYKFKIMIPASYVAVVESFGTKRADVASLATFGYILANEKYGAEARLVVLRFGHDKYKAQIITKSDGPIKTLEDLKGKTFGFTDPTSTSGYLMPTKLFKEKNIKPGKTIFLQKHDSVVTAVYQGRVDAGATFYSPPEDGKIQDARRLVKTQFPDVEEKVKIIGYTDEIPNDPFIFRKDLPEEMKSKITSALEEFIKTEEGKSTLYDLYGVTGLKRTTDKEYDGVRAMLKEAGKSANELLK